MSSSVEFGVLEEWSDISLLPQYRVDLSDDEFQQLSPMLAVVSAETGIVFDLYSSATIGGSALDTFIKNLTDAEAISVGSGKHTLQALARAARHARDLGRPLQYKGL